MFTSSAKANGIPHESKGLIERLIGWRISYTVWEQGGFLFVVDAIGFELRLDFTRR